MVAVIRRFKNGELDSRIHFKQSGELKEFANSFNEMADTIVQNMKILKQWIILGGSWLQMFPTI